LRCKIIDEVWANKMGAGLRENENKAGRGTKSKVEIKNPVLDWLFGPWKIDTVWF
jgi:hypothetical protein